MRLKNLQTNIFQDLEGVWSLHRTIAPGGAFEGQASFIKTKDGDLLYHEQGVLTLDGGQVLEPSKKYLYRLVRDQIQVFFEDGVTRGELFHTLVFSEDNDPESVILTPDSDPGEGSHLLSGDSSSHKLLRMTASGQHLCGDDLYKTSYIFDLPDRFSITHDVQGPKKSYIAKSLFRCLT